MDIVKKFVFITNMEYTRRIATAYDIGYANGTKDTIHKVANLTGVTTKSKPKSKRRVTVKK